MIIYKIIYINSHGSQDGDWINCVATLGGEHRGKEYRNPMIGGFFDYVGEYVPAKNVIFQLKVRDKASMPFLLKCSKDN